MRTTSPGLPVLALALCVMLWGGHTARSAQPAPRTSDLDAFMAQVLARRDDNWSKLQQYVLDERERVQVVGPAGARLYALDRDTRGTSARAPSCAARCASTASR